MKTALVTGGAVRLGRELSLHLAGRGYGIALHCNSSGTAADETAAEIRSLGVGCEIFPCNFLETTDFTPFLEQIQQKMGPLEVLVNSASTYEGASIMDTNPGLFQRQFMVNLQAPFFLTQSFAALSAGLSEEQTSRSVINIIDNKVAFNQNVYAAYLLSKKMLAEFTKLAALELAPSIRVNGISPGVTMPAESRSDEYIQWRVQGIPLKQKGTPAQICQALDMLLENEFMAGQIITVDGGESLTNTGLNAMSFGDQDKV